MRNSLKSLLSFVSFAIVASESTYHNELLGDLHFSHEHAHGAHGAQLPLNYVKYPWLSPNSHVTYPGDEDGKNWFLISKLEILILIFEIVIYPKVTADSIFSGITTFARLPWQDCLSSTSPSAKTPADIVFIGAPFDTGTSYRPGARFGPNGIRAGSRRTFLYGSYNVPMSHNPLRSGLR